MKIYKLLHTLFLLIFISLFGCAAKTPPPTDYSINQNVSYQIGFVVGSNIPLAIQNEIAKDLEIFKNLIVIKNKAALEMLNLTEDKLYAANSFNVFGQNNNLSFLFYIYEADGNYISKTFNFYNNEIVEQSISEYLSTNKNWLFSDKTGICSFITFPDNGEIYINYKFAGVSPILLNMKRANYQLSVSYKGKVFFNKLVNTSNNNVFKFDNVFISQNKDLDKDGVEITGEEKQGVYFISTMIMLLLGASIIIPILLL
ncbi:MAG: hypothetical protein ABIA04_11570 [Pseudomonadota bacterium]